MNALTTSPAVAAAPLPGEHPHAATGHTTAPADAASERRNLSLVEQFNRQWDSLPEIALTSEQVGQLAAMSPADRAVELDVLAMGQHWAWWADYFGKQCSVLTAWHWAAPKVTQHFMENRQRLFAMAEAAFGAARARAAA